MTTKTIKLPFSQAELDDQKRVWDNLLKEAQEAERLWRDMSRANYEAERQIEIAAAAKLTKPRADALRTLSAEGAQVVKSRGWSGGKYSYSFVVPFVRNGETKYRWDNCNRAVFDALATARYITRIQSTEMRGATLYEINDAGRAALSAWDAKQK